jgi:squalene cyclase
MRAGIEFLLSRQNDDGSWGDRDSRSIYTRYHSTWTAMNGLMEYAWRGQGASFPEALTRARGASMG